MTAERYRLLVESVTDYAIYMLDPQGMVISWNPGARRFKGYEDHEIIGQSFSRFYTEEDRASGLPERALSQAAEEGRFESEGWRVRKDGSRFWAHVVIDPILDQASGRVLGYAKITRDLTERRKIEADLDVAREALFQAQKIEMLGQLTGGVAHDFNNLLTAILGSLELVRRQIADERQLTLIDNAIRGASRGVSLTQRMLSFARKQELASQPVAIGGLVAGMNELLQGSIGPLIQIETHFPADLATATADPNQLETALLNLAVNARDAMPRGGVLHIRGSNEQIGGGHPIGLPAGGYVRLSVADNGIGMDAKTLAQATEPFFTTKGVGKGTGLGLSMVHGMAEQLGGRLQLDSCPGQGTTVEIWLPAAASAAMAETARPPVELKTEVAAAARPLTVLAVDDDALVLMNTTALLEDLGHRVIEAVSGREALAILEDHGEVDLLITDHAMPQMTGAQLIAVVGERWPTLPVILATGYADLPAGAGAGVLRLSKPFWQADLEKAVAGAMARRTTAAA
ncbi:ATP-binding protein [Bosea sp. LjRoot237]|uniref:PAS domain-containing sensor histidine kinase n=1 Tax=Bosea sp. LjRoot237 TaxID=3342292 RepID=UPI003ECEA6EB